MKKAIISVNAELILSILQFPTEDVKVRSVHIDTCQPEEVVVVLEGSGLPDSCEMIPFAMIKKLNPTYKSRSVSMFDSWGE